MHTPPLLLVHGFLATRGTMLPLQLQLQRAGLQVHRAHLSPLCIQDVRVLAQQVALDVERVQRARGVAQVDLIGVSQGGLAALWYLRKLGGHTHVRRLITLGTPIQGTWFALVGLPLVGAISKGVWQSLPHSRVVKELAESEAAGPEEIITVARAGDPVAPPERCRIQGAEHIVLPKTRFPLVHQTLGFSPLTAQTVVEIARR